MMQPVDLSDESLRCVSSNLAEKNNTAHIVRADHLVERVVLELNTLGRAATFEFTLSVGALIINRLYGGHLQAWRSRGPKCASFRRLAKHPSLPMSAGSLYRCVAIFRRT
jgi:hypothetical protein